MNWLTVQMAQMRTFGGLLEVTQGSEPGLGQLHLKEVIDPLIGVLYDQGLTLEVDTQLEMYFLLVEDVESAARRLEQAEPGGDLELPAMFTLALADGHGAVLYLPEDRMEVKTVQLFEFRDGHYSRVVATVEEEGERVRLHSAERPEDWPLFSDALSVDLALRECPDGLCHAEGQECGAACTCRSFEVPYDRMPVAAQLPFRFRRGPGRMWEYRCYPDHIDAGSMMANLDATW